jgi:predicted alpha/beta superfamily hydrolase
MGVVIAITVGIIAGLFILGLFVLPGTKNTGKLITKRMAIGMLICITAVSGGCSNQQDTSQKEGKEEIEKNDDSTDSAKTDKSDTTGVKLKIGETEKRELWTQTYVNPDNIDDTFVIDVCLPDDYDKNKTYPVVYLTDCYWRREDYGAIKELYQSGKTREFILIGIGYPDDYNFDLIRQRDLLREPDKFLDMIVSGVIPYVESIYPIDAKDRTFCGASYGGFFMIYSLFQNDGLTKDIFKNYVLASPTFWEYTDGHTLNDYEDLYYQKTDVLKENVYLTVGGEEGKDDFLIPIDDFVKKVEKRGYDGLKLTYKVYEGKGHYTVWVPTLLDGLTMYLAD